ncbi:MAG: DNA-directed RNA polymerase subunit beta [Candidatus Firestonebacteria bacterium]
MEEFDRMGRRKRKDYSKLPKILELPNLLEVQKTSYNNFLQKGVAPKDRKNVGLQSVFNEVFPMQSIKGNITIEYAGYTIGEPKFKVIECKERGLTFGAPLKFAARLLITDPENPSAKVKEVKEQEVFMCELPVMTDKGTFIINGAERVIVNQLHRSPGISFDETEDKLYTSSAKLYTAKVAPYRGSWLEFEFDTNEILYARIDKKRKFFASIILRALGFKSNEDIVKLFYRTLEISLSNKDKCMGKTLAKHIHLNEGGDTFSVGTVVTEAVLKKLSEAGIKNIEIVEPADLAEGINLLGTLAKDTIGTKEDALMEVYRKMRPGQPVTLDAAKVFFDNMFFNPKRYDLGRVGRYKINQKLGTKSDKRVLDKNDIVETIRYLLKLANGKEGFHKDDIDHFGNRRVRAVGELVENQFRIGLVRMERYIKERMSIVDTEGVMPVDLINTKPVVGALREFFGTSQLSQFMDQTNPLAELTHQRRLSALGPGGLDRDRAGFEVRDVHYTHYGRMCPIETPEGPNIGLISSLPTFARINDLGFLETPYRKVKNTVISKDIDFCTAETEDFSRIAPAKSQMEGNKLLGTDPTHSVIEVREKDDYPSVPVEEVNYMDVSPMQFVAVSPALIPFLEHDDANRALMGSNMQRQAVPLIRAEAPVIGTGLEYKVAYDSGVVVIAANGGTIVYVDSGRIEIATEEDKIDVYDLIKYKRSNQDTCISQKPIVKKGQKVLRGQVIADGQSTDHGELALGQNILVGIMAWRGYNFEDAIILSEELVMDDRFTSIHIEEQEIDSRDTKLGEEEITRDIPNVSEEALRNLDEHGIIRIGAEVKSGDILVGKVTPKGESESTPEEKLLRAIFGEKAKDVKNASLKVPPGMNGIVVDVKVFSRKESASKSKEKEQKKRLELELDLEKAKILALRDSEIKAAEKTVEDKKELQKKIMLEKEKSKIRLEELERKRERELRTIEEGENLPAGVIKRVKVYITSKAKISVGDKMAGRHGNKGIVARIVPKEDMPYMPDGTPIQILLNPLGVPSRMNVGQLLECHLGWAAKALGYWVSTPVFDGADEKGDVKPALKEAGLPESGKSALIDGMTGEKVDEDITVGYMYIMKLSHLVDDKVHARSTGPYSLITQQPLGGKAQFGGQRFGEMEVWALEAYGAAHTLQEILTVKSDDVVGRTKIYEAIVKGKNTPEPGLPESFNVLIKELQGLGLDVNLLKSGAGADLKKAKKEKSEKTEKPEKEDVPEKKEKKKKKKKE